MILRPPRRCFSIAGRLPGAVLLLLVAAPGGCGRQPVKSFTPQIVDLDRISAQGGPEQVAAWTLRQTNGSSILGGKAVLLNTVAGSPGPAAPSVERDRRLAAEGFLRVHEKLTAGWPGLAPPKPRGPAGQKSGATDFDPRTYRNLLIEDSYLRLAAMHQALPGNETIADLFRRLRPTDDDAELLVAWRAQGVRAGLVK